MHVRAVCLAERSVDPAAALPVGQAAHGGMPSAATFSIRKTVDIHPPCRLPSFLHVKYSGFVHVRVVCLASRSVNPAAALSGVQAARTSPMRTAVARPSASGPDVGKISIRDVSTDVESPLHINPYTRHYYWNQLRMLRTSTRRKDDMHSPTERWPAVLSMRQLVTRHRLCIFHLGG